MLHRGPSRRTRSSAEDSRGSAAMDISHLRLQQRITYWSPTMKTFQQGTIAWISRRQDLFALHAGGQTEFLTAAQLVHNPCAAADDGEFHSLPAADAQHRPDQERYL